MVTVSTAQFFASTPGSSFGSAPAPIVAAALADAGRRVNADLFPSADLAVDYVCLKAAILLFRHPHSMKMRQADPSQVFSWEYELKQLQRSATMGHRVF